MMAEPLPVRTLAVLMVFCAALLMLVICFWLTGHVEARGQAEPGPAIYHMVPAPEVSKR